MKKPRRECRTPIDTSVELTHVASGARLVGRATDISLGGLRVETSGLLPFGSEVVVQIRLPGAVRRFHIHAVVRWTRQGAMGLQFGALGVRETHLIAELSLADSLTLDACDVAWVG